MKRNTGSIDEHQKVLGVDSAWSPGRPSGAALLVAGELRCLGRTLGELVRLWSRGEGAPRWEEPPGELGELEQALAACRPRVVALDLPLSPLPIRGRRPADDLVASRYGHLGIGTHVPRCPLSPRAFRCLREHGYRWAGPGEVSPHEGRWFLETYPHAALAELLGLERRLPYKVSRRGRYWPELDPSARLERVRAALQELAARLSPLVPGLAERLPAPGLLRRPGQLKGLEDALDAVVCALVGERFREGRAAALGDRQGVIWVPLPPGGRMG